MWGNVVSHNGYASLMQIIIAPEQEANAYSVREGDFDKCEKPICLYLNSEDERVTKKRKIDKNTMKQKQ